jgi:membrane-bound metal-dependent hydrolase YbcI (DUF457 family)
MDNVTHTMLGIAMARAGLAQRFGRGTTLVLAVASNLPDIDGLWVFLGFGDPHFSRRLLTHSVPGLLLLAMLGATVFHWIYRHLSWRTLFGLCLLGATVHVFFDLVNSYGVVLLYPFSQTRFELAWIFIIDLVLLGILLVPAGLGLLMKRRLDPRRFWQASLIAVALYVAACGTVRWQADRMLEQTIAREAVPVEFSYVFPEALGPHRFRGVVKEREGDYRMYLIHVLSGRTELRATYRTDEQHPIVQQARASDKGHQVEWFFQAPVWKLLSAGRPTSTADASEGYLCHAFDLRFVSLVIDRGIPIQYSFLVQNGAAEPLGWH